MMFEGPEKKLEIILKHPAKSAREDLQLDWDALIRICGATILNKCSWPAFDAYLLSESSLFVYDDHIIVITCGQTRLYELAPILIDYWGADNIAYVFYGRKRLIFPDKQLSDFEQEVALIEAKYPGKSYRLGPANDEHMHIFFGSTSIDPLHKEDFTFEILMATPISSAMSIFDFRKDPANPHVIRDALRLEELFPGCLIDDFCFEPQGYSLNGTYQEGYFTIHVTPQGKKSYLSFETNVFFEDFTGLLSHFLSIFQPKQAMLGLYYNSRDPHLGSVEGYTCEETMKLVSQGYHIDAIQLRKDS